MFTVFKKLLLVLPILSSALVDAYGAPGACSGSCWSHDPAVIQRASDGMYFRFSTGSGIQITTATSLSGPWTIQGYALPDGSSINLSGNTDLWVNDTTFSFDMNSTINFLIKTGPRCPLSWQYLLPLLRRVYVRQPGLSHWSRHFFHNGSRIVD